MTQGGSRAGDRPIQVHVDSLQGMDTALERARLGGPVLATNTHSKRTTWKKRARSSSNIGGGGHSSSGHSEGPMITRGKRALQVEEEYGSLDQPE